MDRKKLHFITLLIAGTSLKGKSNITEQRKTIIFNETLTKYDKLSITRHYYDLVE